MRVRVEIVEGEVEVVISPDGYPPQEFRVPLTEWEYVVELVNKQLEEKSRE